MPSKRHHSIAQAIQRNFLELNEEKLWVYDRIANEFRFQKTTEIAVYGQLYKMQHPDLTDHAYDIETMFSTLETNAAPAFLKLRERQQITLEERDAISAFMGMQVVRTPERLDVTKQLAQKVGQYLTEEMLLDLTNMDHDEYNAHMTEYESESDEDMSDITQEELRRVVEERRLSVKQPEDYHLGVMLESGDQLGRIFSQRQWIILHANAGGSYIGSDCGMVLMIDGNTVNHRGHSPASPGMATIFPFSSNSALMISSKKMPSILHASHKRKGVRELNNQLAQESVRIIFSHSKKLLQSISERERLAQWQPKIVLDDETLRNTAKIALNHNFE